VAVRDPPSGRAQPAGSGSDRDLRALLAPQRWLPPRNAKDELRKVFGIIQTHVSETRRLLALPQNTTPLRTATTIEELQTLLADVDPTGLDVDTGWELAGSLKRINLRLADAAYLSSRLQYEASRAGATGRWHGWNDHFSRESLVRLTAALDQSEVPEAAFREAVDHLSHLYLLRQEAGRDRRARAAFEWRRATTVVGGTAAAAIVLNVAAVIALTGLDDLWAVVGLPALIGLAVSPVLIVPWAFEFRDRLVSLNDFGAWAHRLFLIAVLGPPAVVAFAAALAAVHAAGIRLEEKDGSTSGLLVAAAASTLAVSVIAITGFWRRWIFWRRRSDEPLFSAAVGNLVALAVLTELFAVVTVAVISYGGIATGDRVGLRLGIVEQYYAWNLADALPVLELPKTMNWTRPLAFDDHGAGLLLLAYKLLVILPIAGFVAQLIDQVRKHGARVNTAEVGATTPPDKVAKRDGA
jgi:hypothetical protein